MAKSKTGGTRAYIRGRIGSDVYSVGKTSKGARQQVVRSLAETVSNPRSQAQMFGRMIMSTVMQAVSALQPIIDHSFDGFPVGQPSISEFIRRNYALVKADAIAHPSDGNKFRLSEYQEKGIQLGGYVIAAGSAIVPAAVTVGQQRIEIALTANTATVGGLKAALGLSADGYITGVSVGNKSGATFVRVKLSTTLADETAITAENVASLFSQEGNVTATISFASNKITVLFYDESDTYSGSTVIVSDKVDGVWVHNNAVIDDTDVVGHAADAVLPTYPTGTAQFLNGGDL